MLNSNEPVWTPDELKDWEKDERGQIFWYELSRMFQARVSGIRAALRANKTEEALALNGQLDAIEEVMQLPGVIIEEAATADKDKKESPE